MNTGNPKFEHDFEAFLANDDSKLAALYRKLPQPEPDARLDASVRALAQRSVASSTRTPAASHRRWLPVLSAAAVVALAVGFAFRLGPQLWQRPVAVTPAEPVAAPAPPEMQAESATDSMPAPTAHAKPATERVSAAPKPAVKATPQALQKVENAASRPVSRAFPAPTGALREPVPDTAAEAKPPPPAPAMAAPMRARQSVEMESAGAPMQTLAAPATADRNASLYPEHWLANIRQMLRDNQREAALRSLDEFRKKYPDYVLPDDLRDLH